MDRIYEISTPFLKATLVLIIGHIAVKYAVKLINRALNRSRLDDSFTGFAGKAAGIILHIFIILSALSTLGVSTTSLIAAMSAAVVAVGVALKDSLGNVAGGILLLLSPRFRSGDYIKAGSDEGVVINVDLLHTTVRTVDNKHVSIPNGQLINSNIINYSVEPTRRVDITFPVEYEADIEKAKAVILETITRHPLVLREPEEPLVRVGGYEDSSVNIVTKSWCNTADYWNVYFDLTEQVREALSQKGIGIPFNQLDVRIRRDEK